MDATLQGVFNAHFDQFMQTHTLAHKHYQVANVIMACRTEAMGGHVQRCPDAHEEHVQYHSCKHRSCPRCQALAKARWADTQQARLLACDHYHVIFTLPHELLDLWQHNTRWFADALFQAARDTLMTLLADEKHLGAVPGILMALHTWGRTLSLHPHVHCLVQADAQRVTFGYTDHHDQRRRQMTLSAENFLQRVFWHVPEPGQHTVRHYGLYANHGREKRAQCRAQLGQGPEQAAAAPLDWQQFMASLGHKQAGRCSICGKALLRCEELARVRRIKNSIYKRGQGIFVQQGVGSAAATHTVTSTGPP